MIQTKFFKTRKDGVNLYITFSDEGYFIEKVSQAKKARHSKAIRYRYAIDVESTSFEYIETGKPIKYTREEKALMQEAGLKYWVPELVKVEVDEKL
jgi:hypothetical protein